MLSIIVGPHKVLNYINQLPARKLSSIPFFCLKSRSIFKCSYFSVNVWPLQPVFYFSQRSAVCKFVKFLHLSTIYKIYFSRICIGYKAFEKLNQTSFLQMPQTLSFNYQILHWQYNQTLNIRRLLLVNTSFSDFKGRFQGYRLCWPFTLIYFSYVDINFLIV